MILPPKGQLVLFDDYALAALEDIWHEKEMPSKEQDHVDVRYCSLFETTSDLLTKKWIHENSMYKVSEISC